MKGIWNLWKGSIWLFLKERTRTLILGHEVRGLCTIKSWNILILSNLVHLVVSVDLIKIILSWLNKCILILVCYWIFNSHCILIIVLIHLIRPCIRKSGSLVYIPISLLIPNIRIILCWPHSILLILILICWLDSLIIDVYVFVLHECRIHLLLIHIWILLLLIKEIIGSLLILVIISSILKDIQSLALTLSCHLKEVISIIWK